MLQQGPSIDSRRKTHRATFRLSKVRESPLCIDLGLLMHTKTRKKGIIEHLSSLGLSISCTRVLELSTVLGK